MTLQEIVANKAILKCFWCDSIIANGDGKFIALMSEDGVIYIKGKDSKPVPMIFCSSDCLVFDCNIRYNQRVKEGRFRKHFDQQFKDGIPERWKHNKPEVSV